LNANDSDGLDTKIF